ncbi:response regulator [Rhodoligotrophos defluvii]|uniref:response regulator n=1 Tax=Rhodoligotrophos defluvii TaxID=2561934 RepID=UPI0010C96ED0|nr:response regulator [Rhodoligotrophos defluvii]
MQIVSSDEGKRSPPGPAAQVPFSQLNVPHDVRVLIVEDEWLVSLDLEAAFQQAGYQVVGIATSCDEAIEIAARVRPHVATMDIRLRGARDGVDAANELYRRFGIRCLFASAYSEAATMQRVAARPLGWLQKPFMAAQVVSTLTAALRRLQGH